MVQKRKIRCDCGAYLAEQKAKFGAFETDALVCPRCHFTTLTREQAARYAQLKQLHLIIDENRKVIRIGNSMGMTFPDSLQDFGVKVGKKIKTEALGPTSFKVEFEEA